MSELEYRRLDEIDYKALTLLLNKHETRKHLVEHQLFNVDTAKSWVKEKLKVDSTKGCRVRALVQGKTLVGWCGIQLEENKYELAIVLDSAFWGLGRRIFKDLMRWAKEFGHDEVYIYFLHTRPEYRFLQKMAKSVSQVELLGDTFTRYQLSVK